MKRLVTLFACLSLLMFGCTEAKNEEMTITTTGTNNNWTGDLHVELGEINSETEDVSTLLLEYTGSTPEDAIKGPIKVSLIETEGEVSEEFDGLSSDGKLEMDLSGLNIYGKLQYYSPLAIHVAWNENGEEKLESLQFDEGMIEE